MCGNTLIVCSRRVGMNKTDFREDGRCQAGCKRKATFAINFGSECDHVWFGYCGKCKRNECLRVRISEIN